jgi:hypothetical protein
LLYWGFWVDWADGYDIGYNKGSKYDNGYGHLRAYDNSLDIGVVEALAAGVADDPQIYKYVSVEPDALAPARK